MNKNLLLLLLVFLCLRPVGAMMPSESYERWRNTRFKDLVQETRYAGAKAIFVAAQYYNHDEIWGVIDDLKQAAGDKVRITADPEVAAQNRNSFLKKDKQEYTAQELADLLLHIHHVMNRLDGISK